jgi:hypothetical protein
LSDRNNRFEHRYPNKEAVKRNVERLVEHLFELEQETDPGDGDESAKDKDFKAFQALEVAGNLVQTLAGWAIDHQIGLASDDLKFVGLGPTSLRGDALYIDAKNDIDDHRHEEAGSKAYTALGHGDANEALERRALVNLLNSNPGGFPRDLAASFREALRALEHGEVLRVLTPPKPRKNHYTRLCLQLNALCFVGFYVGKGKSKIESEAIIADAFGRSVETIGTWENRLLSELGRLEVKRAVRFSYNGGTHAAAAEQKTIQLIHTPDSSEYLDAVSDVQRYNSQYGEEALKDLARQLHTLGIDAD